MSRRGYPLQAVEDLRRRRRDEAREILAALLQAVSRAQREVDEAEERFRAVEAALDTARRELYAPPEGGGVLDIGVVSRRQTGIEVLGQRLDDERCAVARCQRELDAAQARETQGREDLTQAMSELEAIEIHRERWTQALKLEERRREAKAVDEIVASAYVRAEEFAGRDGA